MTCILDTSAAAAIVFRRGDYESIIDILAEANNTIVPDLYFAEILSVVWKTLRWTDDTSVKADELCRRAYSLVHESVPVLYYWQQIIEFSGEVNHNPYDMAYAVLAKKSGGTLITLDRKLAGIADEANIGVMYPS